MMTRLSKSGCGLRPYLRWAAVLLAAGVLVAGCSSASDTEAAADNGSSPAEQAGSPQSGPESGDDAASADNEDDPSGDRAVTEQPDEACDAMKDLWRSWQMKWTVAKSGAMPMTESAVADLFDPIEPLTDALSPEVSEAVDVMRGAATEAIDKDKDEIAEINTEHDVKAAYNTLSTAALGCM